MKLLHSKIFKGIVWKVFPHMEEHRLMVEVRNEEAMEVKYSLIDLSTFAFEEIQNEELNWWTSSFGFIDSSLIFKHFTDETNPAINELFLYDYKKKEWTKSNDVAERVEVPEEKLPIIYYEESESFKSISKFLSRNKINPIKAIEYLEWEDKVVMSYYEKQNNVLGRYVYVMNQEGQMLLKEKIDQQMKGVVFQSFFTLQNLLIFVKERVELKIYAD